MEGRKERNTPPGCMDFFLVQSFSLSFRGTAGRPGHAMTRRRTKIPAGTHVDGLKKKDTHQKKQILYIYE